MGLIPSVAVGGEASNHYVPADFATDDTAMLLLGYELGPVLSVSRPS